MNIQEWFDKKESYELGVELYSKLPRMSGFTLAQLREKKTLSNEMKLRYELKKALSDPVYINSLKPEKLVLKKKTVVVQEPKIQEKATENQFKKESISMYPFELHGVYRDRVNCFYSACELKLRLNALDPNQDDKALDYILEIERLFDKIDKYWDVLDYWKEHGRIMPVLAKEDYSNWSLSKLYRNKANLESSISKREKTLLSLRAYVDKNPNDSVKRNNLLRKTEALEQLRIDLMEIRNLITKSE